MGNGYLNSRFDFKNVLKCPFSSLFHPLNKLEKLLGEQKKGAKLVPSAFTILINKAV